MALHLYIYIIFLNKTIDFSITKIWIDSFDKGLLFNGQVSTEKKN